MFVLRHKFNAVVKIGQLRALIENEIGKTIKHVQIDSSMKFCLELLNEFCMKEDIVRHR